MIAILILHFWHTGMIYTAELTWHIKSEDTSHALLEAMYFFSQWRMALLFFISGIGARFALGSRNAPRFLKERSLRLAVPVLFAVLVVVPPQIFFQRLSEGQSLNYLQFMASVLQFRFWPEGNFHWLHMWFVVYLFVYSVAALPVFLWIRSGKLDGLIGKGWKWSEKTAFLPFIVCIALPYVLLYNHFPQRYNLLHDPTFFLYYFGFFFSGYLFQSSSGAWKYVHDRRRLWLQIACAAYLVITIFRWNAWQPYYGLDSIKNIAWDGLRVVNAWFWVMAALGYGMRFLNQPSRLLRYANEGIYPFYILHQTLIVVVGFYVALKPGDMLAKYLFNLLFSFFLVVGIYEFLIRPYPIMRFLFGMKRPGP